MIRVHRALEEPVPGTTPRMAKESPNYRRLVVDVRGATETELKAAELFFDDMTRDAAAFNKMVMAHVNAKRLVEAINPTNL